MSRTQTRAEITEQMRAARAELEKVRIELTERAETADTALSDAIAAHKAELGELNEAKAQADNLAAEFQAKVEALTAERDEALAKIESLQAEVTTAQAAKEAAEQAKTKAESALKNPAFADAALSAVGQIDSVQADAEADKAEADAAAESEPEKPQDIAAEYEAMPSGQARQEFWAKNQRKILAALQARSEQE